MSTNGALKVSLEDLLKDLDFPDDRAMSDTLSVLVGEWISVDQLLTCVSSDDLREIELSAQCHRVIQRSAVKPLWIL